MHKKPDHKIRKAVFPVAGLGTRFLPATKANPKEMLPIVDKPLIQYAVEEAILAGVDELVFITSYSKRAIEDHFDSSYELESELEKRGKFDLLKIVQDILPSHVTCVYVRQKQALGLGHAVLCAKSVIGEDPFAVILADDLIDGGDRSCLQQMMDVYAREHTSVVAVEEVPVDQTDRYGIVALENKEPRVSRIKQIVEKPPIGKAPSSFAVVGRYLLTSEIFTELERVKPGSGGEIQLTDAIARLMTRESVMAYAFEGTRYDCGSKLGYLHATLAYALKHPELAGEFRALMASFG